MVRQYRAVPHYELGNAPATCSCPKASPQFERPDNISEPDIVLVIFPNSSAQVVFWRLPNPRRFRRPHLLKPLNFDGASLSDKRNNLAGDGIDSIIVITNWEP